MDTLHLSVVAVFRVASASLMVLASGLCNLGILVKVISRALTPVCFSSAKLSPRNANQGATMRLARFIALSALFLFAFTPLEAQKSDKITIQGKLSRVMAIGAETSGWAIELNPVLTVHEKQISSMEIVYVDTKKLEALENKTVKATGTLSNVTGIETGQRPVLNLTSIKQVKEKPAKEK
jgi:hypothetical protein